MTIEQEFFKAFKPKYIYRYRVYIEHNNGHVIKYYWGKELLINVFSDKTYKKREHIKELKVCEVIRHFPPITPEIVLGLEEIIFNSNNDITLQKNSSNKTWIYYDECNHYEIWREDKERKNALLKLCIQLKDEIQDQVRVLFNEM